MSKPRVHLAIPVRNVAPWLDEALDSLHRQTEQSWTATVVDDDSDDDSPRIAGDWARRDPRIELVQRGRLGLVGALNEACSRRGGAPFLARFDGDDICRPDRLERQLAFLEANEDIDVVDSRFALDRSDGEPAGGMLRYQRWHDGIESHDDFEREFLVENPICHPASMVRASVLEQFSGSEGGPYRQGDFPEDYDLWLRLQRAGARFHKLPERLVTWRDRPSRATRTDPVYRREAFFHLKWEHLTARVDVGAERLAVWGAKKGGRPWIRALTEGGSPPVAVVDIDPRALGTTRHGVPVIPPSALPAHRPDRVLIAVGAAGARSLIESELAALRLPSLPVAGIA